MPQLLADGVCHDELGAARPGHPADRHLVGDVMQAGDVGQAVPEQDGVLCAQVRFLDLRADLSRCTGRFGSGPIVRMAMPDVMRDNAVQEAALRASGLDWTIVRPAKLKDRPGTGTVAASSPGPARRAAGASRSG